ncbi:MAG: sigma-70 family RNA polymerase sigma factor [Bacilli bacterium]|nr:sigma-70 family RNA polymerase sigma factor [Bacilli bacterium]
MLTLTDELISSYEKLVYSIISKYSNERNKDDLFQAGMMGIIDASKKYDNSSNVKFTSFASKYILGEVLKYLREDRNIKISRDIIRDYKRINIVKDHIYKMYGRPTNNKELSKLLNMNEERINEVINYNEKELSINMIISDDEKISLEDTISDNRNNYFELNDALKELSDSEKRLIYERYYENKTQTEIAKEKNISQVKVYRYERKILDKLKDKMS